MAIQPYKGATTAQFYVLETVAGVTPTSPAWYPLRSTGGLPALTRESLVSNELDGSRETTAIRSGSRQVAGEYAIELSSQSQDEFLAGAMTSSWVAGATVSGLSINVSASAKTFTRASGDFTAAGVSVGDLVAFPGLAGDNKKPFIVTAVTPLVVTGAAIPHTLTDATAASTSLILADTLETGNLCKTYSILTWFKGKCGNPDSYLLTKGVEISGFSIEQAVNAFVTGSFPVVGLSQEIVAGPPAGSTFPYNFAAQPFSSVDVTAFNGQASLKLIDNFTITNDNGTSAQYALGDNGVAFVERGRAENTFSLSGKLYDTSLLNLFLNETLIELTSILSGPSGAMSFTLRKAKITAVTPEIGGPESVTIGLEGQATGNALVSSIIIQRIVYP